MDPTRRALLTGSAAAATVVASEAHANSPRAVPLGTFGIEASALGLRPGPDDQSQALTRALKLAASRNAPLVLPPGEFRVGNVMLPDDCRLAGVPGATSLVQAAQGSMLVGRDAKRVSLTGLVLDGGKNAATGRDGLVSLTDVADLTVTDCAVLDVAGIGLSLTRAAGRVSHNRFAGLTESALMTLDAKGLAISDNVVERCGNNGIQVWRSAKGDDGTIVTGNRVSAVRADAGGSGQYGNGISIFRAGNVMVSGNQISGCAFSAIRGNAASNVQMLGNHCTGLGEVAIYAEFGFEGAVIANNIIDLAALRHLGHQLRPRRPALGGARQSHPQRHAHEARRHRSQRRLRHRHRRRGRQRGDRQHHRERADGRHGDRLRVCASERRRDRQCYA